MSDSRPPKQRARFLVAVGLTLSVCLAPPAPGVGGAARQGGFMVFGRVSLPDGKPAGRVKVRVEATNGLSRETQTDDQGNYEFRGLGAGRYRVSAANPAEPEQYSDPAESDTTRSYANRLQINVYLRLPLHGGKENRKPGTISADEAAQNTPKPARKAYDQGVRLQKGNRDDEALIRFNQAIELYPSYVQALTERANLLMQRNQLAEAGADFERALQINDRYAPALRGAGYCQIQQRKFEAAVSNLERALRIEPDIALTHLLLGYAHLSLDRYGQAQQSLRQALKIGPESAARAHVYLAETYAYEEKFKEAADEVRAYLRIKPDAADAAKLKELEARWRAQIKSPPK